MSVTVRVGIPSPGGMLVRAARDAGLPVLISANPFMVRDDEFRTVRVRKPDLNEWGGLDAALDSAGYVAASRYGGYPWSIADYLELAESYPWRFWSTMDYCVEPEIATSKPEVFFRIAETCRMYGELAAAARDRGLCAPMPILQGWEIDHYRWCFERYPILNWPDLVGVGSICRREVNGPNGVLAIVEGLDKVLPPQCKLHLFGVKGLALQYLNNHPRIESTDSMAWDFALRKRHPLGRTQALRAEAMAAWARRAAESLNGQHRPYDQLLFPKVSAMPSEELDEWLELVLDNEIDAFSARWHVLSQYIFA